MPMAAQTSSKALEVNSPALSTLILRIGYSGNWDLSCRMFAMMRAKTRFLEESSEVFDHFAEASIMARKKRKGPEGGSIGPHTSA